MDLEKLPKPINEYKVDVIIDDVTATKLDQISKFNQVMAINEIAVKVYGQPLPFEFILKYANMDPTIRAGLVTFQQQAEQQRKQQAQLADTTAKLQGLSSLATAFKPEASGKQAPEGTPTANAVAQTNGFNPQ